MGEPSYPLIFEPIYKERVWGGSRISTLFGRHLPPGNPIGESWEISDRPGDNSRLINGSLAGTSLHTLVERYPQTIFGRAIQYPQRFPILVKIIDAQDVLSVQVHPHEQAAALFGGEPKTEMWYVVDALPESEVYLGLRAGITRDEFEQLLAAGKAAEALYKVTVKPGDIIFIPAGRIHALGRGTVVFEIQQNSDTTYRVYDWGRVSLDGKPRELHLRESLASINFDDVEPGLVQPQPTQLLGRPAALVVDTPYFSVFTVRLGGKDEWSFPIDQCLIVGVVSGRINVTGNDITVVRSAGEFVMLPAKVSRVHIYAQHPAELLLTFPKLYC